MMTPPKFKRFKKEFRAWQTKLGLAEYTVTFKLKKLPDSWAEFAIDAQGCVGTLVISTAHKWTLHDVRCVALHECLHLLVARLTEIGSRRFVEEDEISHENERVVCILEKILCNGE